MRACLPVSISSDTMQFVCQKKYVKRALFLLLHPLDLPALKEIVFDNASYALQGDGRTDNKTKINGMQSYDNTLEMIGKNMIDSLF